MIWFIILNYKGVFMKSIENYIKQIKNNEDIENYLSSELRCGF